MPDTLSENEFTQRFIDQIQSLNLDAQCKEPLNLELHYGEDEPVLNLSLKDAYNQYQAEPQRFDEIMAPYFQDLKWTAETPRILSKDLYQHCLPTLRNFMVFPPTESELTLNSKGPISYEDVLKAPTEHIVMQFNYYEEGIYTPLCKGDTLPCIPDQKLLAQLSLHNLALATEAGGITCTPLPFENLRSKSYLVGFGDERIRPCSAALSCIPQVMASLEETFRARHGLIAIMPAQDQLIISVETDEQALVELGVLAQQLASRAPIPLSKLIWSFDEGNLAAVQALDLEEISDEPLNE